MMRLKYKDLRPDDSEQHMKYLYNQDPSFYFAYFGCGLLAHLSPQSELIGWDPSRRPSVRASVRLFPLSNMNISTTSGPIPTKFYLKHHWGWGKAALGFGPDWIGNLISMATDSSHRVIMGKILLAL